MCKVLLSVTVDAYRSKGFTALPLEASQCAIHRYGPSDEDIFQVVELKTGYNFSNISGLYVDLANMQTVTHSSCLSGADASVVPVVLSSSNSEKVKLIFPYLYRAECPLTRWTLINSLNQVVTIVPTKDISAGEGSLYYMRVFRCRPEQVRDYERAISMMAEEDEVMTCSVLASPLVEPDLVTFCKHFTTEQWCRWTALLGKEHAAITDACHMASRRLLQEAAHTPGFKLSDVLNGQFPLLQAIRFIPDYDSANGELLGFAFEFDSFETSHLVNLFTDARPGWGTKGRPVVPLERWASFFKPLPSSWAKFECALSSVLEQRCLHLMHKKLRAIRGECKAEATQQQSSAAQQLGKRARRTARKRGAVRKQNSSAYEADSNNDPDQCTTLEDEVEISSKCVSDIQHEIEGEDSSDCSMRLPAIEGLSLGQHSDVAHPSRKFSADCHDMNEASPSSVSTKLGSSEGSTPRSDSEASCTTTMQNQHVWLGRSFDVQTSSIADVVRHYQSGLGTQWHVMCAKVKNTFLEPVDIGIETSMLSLRRTRSCGALQLSFA
jgi:hypothetical protein